MTANTILSDINEIYTGYVLNGNKWFDNEAKRTYENRLTQCKPEEAMDAMGKAQAMAEEFVSWAKAHGYRGAIKGVWWTARPGSMTAAFGAPVDQKKNPTDILIQFSSGPSKGFLGLSAKATKGKGDIGFKNPGVGTVDKSLNIKLGDYVKKETDRVIKKYDLPISATERKKFIRTNFQIKKNTEIEGTKLLKSLRDQLLAQLKPFNDKKLMAYLLSDWMDAEIILPPYIKVTGQGNKAPYSAVSMDPTSNPKLDALAKYPLHLEEVGNDSIGVKAGEKKIMKIRFKFESEKMASSMKLSGDPW
jgi:hypothetical protein